MSSRAKGVRGEREVAEAWQLAGAQVRGLESGGDHLIIYADGLTFHSETKRAERLKLPEWLRQLKRDAPQGTIPLLHHRQNRGKWHVTMELDDLTAIVAWAMGYDARKK